MLWTSCCRHKCFPVRATFVADTNFVSGTQKMFQILFRNILCRQQMFPSLRSMETQHSFCVPRVCAPKKHHEQQCVRNNVSSFARALQQVSNMFETPAISRRQNALKIAPALFPRAILELQLKCDKALVHRFTRADSKDQTVHHS